MLIIADFRISEQIKLSLQKLGELVLLKTENVVYESIAGHPDIFLCKTPQCLMVAPQTPKYILTALKKHKIPFQTALIYLRNKYPQTIAYNAVFTDNFFIHNTNFTEPAIMDAAGQRKIIHVNQGYTACNLIALGNHCFVTSDKGIEKELKALAEVHYFSPENIILSQQKHGFLGGCCGILDNTVYFTGYIQSIPRYENLQQIIRAVGYNIDMLSEEPLTDFGGILFLREGDFSH